MTASPRPGQIRSAIQFRRLGAYLLLVAMALFVALVAGGIR